MAALRRVALALVAPLAPLAAQEPTPPAPAAETTASGTFVLFANEDTLAVERVSRDASGRTVSDLRVLRGGAFRVRHTVVGTAAALVTRSELEAWTPGRAWDAPPTERLIGRFTADSVVLAPLASAPGSEPGPPLLARAVPAGTLPYLNLSVAGLEQIARRARLLGGPRVEIPVVNYTGGGTFTVVVERTGSDSVMLSLGPVAVALRMTEDGRVRVGSIPSQRVRFVRVETLPPR